MKKYIIFTIIIGFMFAACNPNKDIYDMIESAEEPYHESFDYELTDADYSAIKKLALANAQTDEDSLIANDLDTYKSFSVLRSAADLIPAFLAGNYIALDSASSLNMKYKYSVNEYDSIHVMKKGDVNYFEMFGTEDTCFSNSVNPSEYLLTIDTVSNYFFYITCRYGNTYANSVDSSFVYTFIEGSWETPDNAYILTDADYESMGSPGSHHDFSGSDKPEHYLPGFFKSKYPYAYEKDLVNVFFNYDSGGNKILMDAYMFKGTTWINATNKISPFIHNGTEWIFDPTIRYMMSLSEDYQIIVDYVTNNPDIPDGYLDEYHPENTEYYFGASSYYKNFYLKLYKRKLYDPLALLEGLTDEEASETILERINEAVSIFLYGKYPEAEPIINGIEIYYAITYDTYGENSVRNKYTVTYKCIGIGEFEFISGPELAE